MKSYADYHQGWTNSSDLPVEQRVANSSSRFLSYADYHQGWTNSSDLPVEQRVANSSSRFLSLIHKLQGAKGLLDAFSDSSVYCKAVSFI